MHQGKLVGIGLCAVLSLLISSQLFAQEDAINKRRDLMKANYDSLKAIKKAVQEKDYATIEVKAKDIMGNMDKVLPLFPKGSTSEKSRAKDEIWEKWDEFSKHPPKVRAVAETLSKAAAAKDETEVQVKFKDLGSESPFRSGACYECHKSFLKEKKKNGG